MRAVVMSIAVLVACGPSIRGHNNGDGGGSGGPCNAGTMQCVGNELQTCQNGMFVDSQQCAMSCDDHLGCVMCQPGTGTCNGNTSMTCLPDGSGYFPDFCDPLQGETCDAGGSGICVGACSSHTLGTTYIGCDYYAMQASQLVQPSFQFAVAISNTTSSAAMVTIDGGTLTTPINLTVNPNQVATQYLPWVPTLKTCNTQGFLECGPPQQYGALAVKGAYHVRSTEPVTVYQFSPLDYTDGSGNFSYSNDASLLFPTNVWTGNYIVPSWQFWQSGSSIMPGVIEVGAAHDGTHVTITPRASTTGGNGAPSFVAGQAQTVTLNQGDVLQLMTQTGDLTGSIVAADQPVEALGGQHCTQVPIGFTACDHIEETVFPVEALATSYLVATPFLSAGPRAEVVRVVAAAANTTVMFDPASVHAPVTLANPGDFVELSQVLTDFAVSADHKILVAQYMESENAPGGSSAGDPSMSLAVPTAQFRMQYQFHAPTNYTNNYVNVIAMTGVSVTLDNVAVPATSFTAIGSSGFGVARMPLSNTGNGTHTATSAMPFGITVYGYGSYTSYWYPGGLDLQQIVVQ